MKMNFIFVEDDYHEQYNSNYHCQDSSFTNYIPKIGDTVYVNGRDGVIENFIYHFKEGLAPYIDVMIKDNKPIDDDGLPTDEIPIF